MLRSQRLGGLPIVVTAHAQQRAQERDDNLLCVAAVIDNVLVIKTVMHHWRPAP